MTRSDSKGNDNGNTPNDTGAYRHPPAILSIHSESGQASQRHVQRQADRGTPRENALMVAHRSLALVTLARAYLDDLKVRG